MTDPWLRELQGWPTAQLAQGLERGHGQRSGMLAAMAGATSLQRHRGLTGLTGLTTSLLDPLGWWSGPPKKELAVRREPGGSEQLSVQIAHGREPDAQRSPVSFHWTQILSGPLPGASPAHPAGPAGKETPQG